MNEQQMISPDYQIGLPTLNYMIEEARQAYEEWGLDSILKRVERLENVRIEMYKRQIKEALEFINNLPINNNCENTHT